MSKPMHAHALGECDRAAAQTLGASSVPVPGQGHYSLSPWEYTLAELFSDAGYATAPFGKWHLGGEEGRLPTDQGFDDWFGIKNTTDEAGYTSCPMFHETGYPAPQTWEGVKGSPSQPVDEYNLETRATIDEKIAERTGDAESLVWTGNPVNSWWHGSSHQGSDTRKSTAFSDNAFIR